MVKIIIDNRIKDKDGIGRYCKEVMNSLIKESKKDFDYYFIGHNILTNSNSYTNFELEEIDSIIKHYNPSIYHSLDYKAPLNKYNSKVVTTVHDTFRYDNKKLCYTDKEFIDKYGEKRYEELKKLNQKMSIKYSYSYHFDFYKFFFKESLFNSDLIVTHTNFVKNEILKKFTTIKSNKIEVIHPGLDHLVKTKPYEKIENYLLYYGQNRKHKNVSDLLNMIDKIPINLIIAGKDFKKYSKKNIISLGYVDDKFLSSLITGAIAVINPSNDEGFGLPLAESTFLGAKVISSNKCEAHKEILKENAIFINFSDEKELLQAIEIAQKINRPEYALFTFTWKNMAMKLEMLYKKLLNA